MKPSIRTICETVGNYYEVTLDEILSKDRHRSIVEARQVAMWIARKTQALSYPELGREFGRDHSTVMQAIRKVDRATGPMFDNVRRLYALAVSHAPRRCGEWSDATGAREIEFRTAAE